ncbi:MAG TPA: hypothetical protein VFS00_34330 [Polyangiaceae bacterium]|nr:hypothetical protein [Polyangiaceae bacterium]
MPRTPLRQALLLALLPALAACAAPASRHGGAPATAPGAPAGPSSRAAERPRVFVEVMLLEGRADELATSPPPSFDFDELAARYAGHVRTLHLLVADGSASEIALPGASQASTPQATHLDGTSAGGLRVRAKADVVEPAQVRLDLGIDFEGPPQGRPLRETVAVGSGQVVVFGAGAGARGERRLVLCRADIVRSDGDLRRIYEAKQRRRDGRSSSFGRHGNERSGSFVAGAPGTSEPERG